MRLIFGIFITGLHFVNHTRPWFTADHKIFESRDPGLNASSISSLVGMLSYDSLFWMYRLLSTSINTVRRPLLEVLGRELLTWLPAAAAFGNSSNTYCALLLGLRSCLTSSTIHHCTGSSELELESSFVVSHYAPQVSISWPITWKQTIVHCLRGRSLAT